MTDIDELMARMTLEEKCAQLGCMWFSGMLVDGELALDRLALAAADGIGQVGRIAIEAGAPPLRVAELANQVQRYLVEETRLGIPAVIHEESTGDSVRARRRSSRRASTWPRPGIPSWSSRSPQ